MQAPHEEISEVKKGSKKGKYFHCDEVHMNDQWPKLKKMKREKKRLKQSQIIHKWFFRVSIFILKSIRFFWKLHQYLNAVLQENKNKNKYLTWFETS